MASVQTSLPPAQAGNREFRAPDEVHYNRAGPVRWIVSHVLRYKLFLAVFILGTIGTQLLNAISPELAGQAFNEVIRPHPDAHALLVTSLELLAVVGGIFLIGPAAIFATEILAQRLERDTRDELYLSLLSKSQTFHNRQRVGDIMARATGDVRQLNPMMNPGVYIILDSFMALVIPTIFIGFLNPQLLAAPLLFIVAFLVALRQYMRQLNPVAGSMRMQFGAMNGDLEESITGIEVVKATAQEEQEERKFERQAHRYRDFFVRNGRVQAFYLPRLLVAIALVGAFLHGLILVIHGQLSIGGLVTYIGLMGVLRYPSDMSVWTFSLVQLGRAGAERILKLMREETELDENERGHAGQMRGEITFEHVSFSFGATPVLKDLTFTARPGQTVAIVGQTASGKTTLTKLVNRTYDATEGSVRVDDVDVRDWNLDSLRSQISTIEQDIFLFSRSIAENIGFSLGQQADRAAIERAAREAQAHDFIMGFADGYETVIGERGVTLSGGQRQRIAIARALLTNPRILILDDSTSAIDSATEDEIQRAIRRVLEGRTTLLITHRLSQIRWADKILVLKRGELVDQGTHEELMARSDTYRRIFAHYDSALPSGGGHAVTE